MTWKIRNMRLPPALVAIAVGILLLLSGGADAQPSGCPFNSSTCQVKPNGAPASQTLANLIGQPSINVLNYGATGDGTAHALSTVYPSLAVAQAVCASAVSLAQTTDWCALQAALDYASTKTYGTRIQVPARRYVITTALSVTISGVQAVVLEGDDLNSTEILQTTAGADGLDVTISGSAAWLRQSTVSSPGPTFSATNLSFVKSSAAVDSNGIAATATAANAGIRQVRLDNVGFRGDAASGAWLYGVNMTGINEPDINNIFCHSGSTLEILSSCIGFAGSVASGTMVDMSVDNVRMAGGLAAINIGPRVQGVYARRINSTSGQYGVYWNADGTGSPDSLTVADGQFNNVVGSVYAENVASVIVHDNYMFPLTSSVSPTLGANVGIGNSTLTVSSVTGVRVGQRVDSAGFAGTARVQSILGLVVTMTETATGAVASGTTVTFRNSPDWIGVRVGDGARYTITGNIFNLGGLGNQVGVLAFNMAGGAITGNFGYNSNNTSGLIHLTGTTSSTIVTGNSCRTCVIVGSDSNTMATGNFGRYNVLNTTMIGQAFSFPSQIAVSNGLLIESDNGGMATISSHGYPFIATDTGATARFRAKAISGPLAGVAVFTSEAIDAGGTVTAGSDTTVQFTGANAGNTQIGSTTSPVQVLATYTVATLPACGASIANGFAVVSDATAPTYRGALVGGGAVKTLVFCDSSAWTSH